MFLYNGARSRADCMISRIKATRFCLMKSKLNRSKATSAVSWRVVTLCCLALFAILCIFFAFASSATTVDDARGEAARVDVEHSKILLRARDAITRLRDVQDIGFVRTSIAGSGSSSSSKKEHAEGEMQPPPPSLEQQPKRGSAAKRVDGEAVRIPQVKHAVKASEIQAKLLSIDFHISPIADLKYVIGMAFSNVHVEDRSLSGACVRTKTCATDTNLAVLHQGDVDNSMYIKAAVRNEFFTAYSGDALRHAGATLVSDSDAMVCSHPTGMCELIMPFGRPAILWATTRFEQGRERHVERFSGFVKNFRALASRPGSAVLANNMYDVHYVHYFTGIMPRYVPSHSGFPGVKWTWTEKSQKRTILVHGYRPHNDIYGGLNNFLKPLRESTNTHGFKFEPLREALGNNYAYEDLASFPAILHFPYQVSIMSFFEQYRMGIPIIAPSLSLLTRWHMESLFVSERTWDTVLYNKPASKSVLPRHPEADEPFDPNDETSEEAVRWWLQWADYYVFPHVILFDSWADLTEKLNTVDFEKVSADMKEVNERTEADIRVAWTDVFSALPAHQDLLEADKRIETMGYDQRMDFIYGKDQWANYN
jgi:hypothetical protein